jgi:hypothetical protein
MILQPPLTLRFPAGRVSFGPLSAPRRPFGARRLLQTATKETGPVPAKTHGSILSESRKKRQTLAKRTQPLEPLSPEAPNYRTGTIITVYIRRMLTIAC